MGGATVTLEAYDQPTHISIHTPRGGSDYCAHSLRWLDTHFNPHSPWGERLTTGKVPPAKPDFNPHSPWGERLGVKNFRGGIRLYFNPHSPWGERRRLVPIISPNLLFQSTLPVGGATFRQFNADGTPFISIHTPRGGSDLLFLRSQPACLISIHTPRGGSDGMLVTTITMAMTFQSTLPVGGATRSVADMQRAGLFQSTLPVGGATRYRVPQLPSYPISIHTPRGGSDLGAARSYITDATFQSTLPVGGATMGIPTALPF